MVTTSHKHLRIDFVTPPQSFFDANGDINDVDRAFRDDNVIAVCDDCYKVRRKEDKNIWRKGHIFLYDDSVFNGILRKNKEMRGTNATNIVRLRQVVIEMATAMKASPYDFGPSDELVKLMNSPDMDSFLTFAAELKRMEEKTRTDAEALFQRGQNVIKTVITKRGWERPEDLLAMAPTVAPPPATPAVKVTPANKPSSIQMAHIMAGQIVPYSACRLPETVGQFILLDKLQCVMSNCTDACDSTVSKTCDRCGVTYCPHHLAGHKR
jgi:hypothetical protein